MTITEAVAHVRRHLPEFRKAVAEVERWEVIVSQYRKTMDEWFQRQRAHYEADGYGGLPEAVQKEWNEMNKCHGKMRLKENQAVDEMKEVGVKMDSPLINIPGSGVSRWHHVCDMFDLRYRGRGYAGREVGLVFNFDEFEFYLASLPIRQRIASWQERQRDCPRKLKGECQVGEVLVKEGTHGITGFIKVERITPKGQQWVGTNLSDGSEYRQSRKGGGSKTPVTVITEEFAQEGIELSNEYKELREQHGLTEAA